MTNDHKIKVEIDLPVYNEDNCLEANAIKLINYLKDNNFNFNYKIVIIDNASTDNTKSISLLLKTKYPEVDYIRINTKGRGRALREAWERSDADIVSYMDIDLSTNLESLDKLITTVAGGNYDLATGSRMLKDSKIKRSFKRELISRCYVLCLKYFLKVSFDDAQCGFKAINRKVINNILPKVLDQEWFFDSELLFRCQKASYKIKELPIEWIEDGNSKVKIIPTSLNYLSGLMRLKKEFNQKNNSDQEFNNYAKNYNYGLDNPLKKIFGNKPDDFFKIKINWLLNLIKQTGAKEYKRLEILDFGCGTGLFLKRINDLKLNINLSGADTSKAMLNEAQKILTGHSNSKLHLISDNDLPPNHFDIIIVSSVLHHINKSARQATINYLTTLLKKDGYLIIFEHNPLNPLTNLIVKTTKIDQNAILLSPPEILNYLKKNYKIKFINLDYIMFFPPRFNYNFINFLEKKFIKLPFGGQYVVTIKKITS